MPIKGHIELLKQGAATWNQWRKDDPGIIPNLRGANLIGEKLIGANLTYADLADADLSGANLTGRPSSGHASQERTSGGWSS